MNPMTNPETWDDWIPRWLAPKAATTAKIYRDEIENFGRFVEWPPLAAVSQADIERYQNNLIVTGLKPNTIARRIATIGSLLSFVHKRDQRLLPRNVGAAVQRVQASKSLMNRSLSEAEVLRLFDREPNPRNRALFRLLYSGGRISELVNLHWKDICWRGDDALVTIPGIGSKVRTIVVCGRACEPLRAIAPADPEPEGLVLRSSHGALDRIYAVHLVKRSGQRAGIKRRISCDSLRQAGAMHALERGCPLTVVSKALGHRSLASTCRYLRLPSSDTMTKYHVV